LIFLDKNQTENNYRNQYEGMHGDTWMKARDSRDIYTRDGILYFVPLWQVVGSWMLKFSEESKSPLVLAASN
jgi:hypothetical protein